MRCSHSSTASSVNRQAGRGKGAGRSARDGRLVRAAILACLLFAGAGALAGPGAPVAAPAALADPSGIVRTWIAERFGNEWSRFDLLDVRWTNGPPPADSTIDLLTGEGEPTRNGTLLLWAEVGTPGRPPSRYPLTVVVRPWVETPVTERSIPRKTLLGAGDYRIEERPLAELRGASPARIDGSMQVRTRRNLRPGEVITEASVEEPPLVVSGDRVSIHLVSGAVRLIASGIARGTGRFGDMIPVENVDSRRIVLAAIVAEGRVEVGP